MCPQLTTSTNNCTFAPQARGSKQYELTDHLGNIRTVVPDIKEPQPEPSQTTNYLTDNDNFRANIHTLNNYYPYGMLQAGRSRNAGGYRFGFNGMEQTKGVQGNSQGTFYDYKNRDYDPWSIRFKRTDALEAKYPFYSPYQFAGNKPINSIDLDGLEEFIVIRTHYKTTGEPLIITIKNDAMYHLYNGELMECLHDTWEKYSWNLFEDELPKYGTLTIDEDENRQIFSATYDPGSTLNHAAYALQQEGIQVEGKAEVSIGPQLSESIEIGDAKAEMAAGGNVVLYELNFDSQNPTNVNVSHILDGKSPLKINIFGELQEPMGLGGGLETTLSGKNIAHLEKFEQEGGGSFKNASLNTTYTNSPKNKDVSTPYFKYGGRWARGLGLKAEIKISIISPPPREEDTCH